MGEHFYGLHYKSSSSAGQGMYICSGRQADQIFTLVFHNHILQGHTSSRAIFIEVFQLHNLPRKIVSDRDGCFINVFWQDLFRLVGTNLSMSIVYHQQTNGQTYIFNKWVERYLKNYVGRKQCTWVSIVTTQITTCLSGCFCLEHCMDTMHPLLWRLCLGIAGSHGPNTTLRRFRGFYGQ
jgi:hypothetical protein